MSPLWILKDCRHTASRGGSEVCPASVLWNPHSTRCFHRAQEDLALAVKCFYLEVTYLLCAYSPLATMGHMAHLTTRGTESGSPPMSQEPDMGDSGNISPKGPCRNEVPRATWLSRGSDRWTPGPGDSKGHSLPTISHSTAMCCWVTSEPEALPRALPTACAEEARGGMITPTRLLPRLKTKVT